MWSMWSTPTFPSNMELTCSECGETKVTTNDVGWVPDSWSKSWLCSSDGNGNLIKEKAVVTCPACIRFAAEEEARDEFEQECDALWERKYR